MNAGPRHVFVPDHELPADIGGRRFGACCALPEDNRAHSPPDRPPDDRSNHILGEHQND
jgi:hypothetical protein